MTSVSAGIVLVAIALGLYSWLAYPLALVILGRGTRSCRKVDDSAPVPRLTVIVSAHNAADVLPATLESLLSTEYPAERRSIIVVSDSSDDDTIRIAQAYKTRGVLTRHSRRRRGKTACENMVLPVVSSDIVVFMDANVILSAGALRFLATEFRDPNVGVVSGTDVLIESNGVAATAERIYSKFEMWIRERESLWSGLVGASGCFYAIRRSLYVTLRPSMTRDFATVLLAARRGQRAVLAPNAQCRIASAASARIEYRRKVRTITQGLETLLAFRDLLNPLRYGRFSIALISHKLFRWLLPLVAPAAAGAAGYLLLEASGTVVPWIVSGAAALAMVKPRLAAAATYVVLVHAAALAAWMRVIRGQRITAWEPTRRSPLVLSRRGRDRAFL